MKTVVTKDVAARDVDQWLDKQKVNARQREAKQKEINLLVEAMTYGEVRLNDAGHMVQVLNHPTATLKELTYSERITVDDVSKKTRSRTGNDAMGVIVAYISAATGTAMSVLESMDNSDLEVASAIVAFF